MKFFMNMFNITPFVIIPLAVLGIIALSIENKKAKRIIFAIAISCGVIFVITLMGIAVPYIFLSGMFENGAGILLMIAIIVVVWDAISLFIKFKNKLIIYKNDVKDIYIRDVDVEYSPAVLSVLMNNKIETKKDLSATILNLCAKNILKIEKVNEKIEIVDLKNEKEISKLMQDEKYAYKMLVEGVTNYKINYWKNKVEDEYKKYKFSKEHERPLAAYLIGIYVVFFIGIMLYFIITGESEITGKPAEILGRIIVATFIAAWEMVVFSGVNGMLNTIINRNQKYEFKDTYTKKGAKEYSKWKKFENFIEDFSLIKEREHESVAIWGKYLSYSIALGINKKCDNELYRKIEKEYSFDLELFYKMFEYDKEE